MNHLITQFDQMDGLFNQRCHPRHTTNRAGSTDEATVLRPRVDVLETDTSYVLEVDLPGVAKDDLKIEVESNVLSIEAARKNERSEDLHEIHVERAWNARFLRRFTLGKEVESDTIEAKLENGVLRLTVPKREKALPRRISIK